MVILYIGGHQVIDSTMTIGMLIAFIGFKGHFTARTGRLIDTFIQYRMQAVHCERLADIVLHPSEDTGLQASPLPRSPLKVELIDVSFRCSEQAPWILRHINLTVAAGESLIITGRSGCGKSTLAKLILGLLAPTEGRILIGGIPIAEIGQAQLRAAVGTILQEDQVLAGTLAENIAGFDLDASLACIQEAAQFANLHRVIIKLPMGYQTNVSDSCSTLSSGQKQRLLLARALYKQPRLLVLDEATSNLDLHTEQHVIQTMKQIKATKITIAHRQETLAMAERVIHLERGMVITDKSLNEK
jgi:ATP-binding cassette subfamily B protein RaxB